jgi:hypothetical protein
MELDMPQNTYALHELINGSVILKLKKPIKARGLSIRLEGKEMVVTDGTLDADPVREWQIFCDVTVPLGGDRFYSSGEYGFKIDIPDEASRGFGKTSGTAGKMLKTVGGFVGTPGVIEWHIIARLDIPMGIDLSKKKQIFFRRTGDVPKKYEEGEFRHLSRAPASIGGRRRQLAVGMKDTPGDQVYGEGVGLCPQCDSPYLKKKKEKQCDICGEFLPES